MLAVCFPFREVNLCRTTENKTSIVIVILFGLILYSFNLNASGLKLFDLNYKCVSLDKWVIFSIYMTLLDIIITMVVPFALISVINTLIALKITRFNCKALYFKKRQHSEASIYFSRLDASSYSIGKFNNSIKSTSTRLDHVRLDANPRVSVTPSVTLQIPSELNTCSRRLTPNSVDRSRNVSQKSTRSNYAYERTYSTCSYSLIRHGGLEKVRQEKARKNSHCSTKYRLSEKSISNASNRNKIYSRTTKVLLSISTTFLILVIKI